MSNYDYVIVGAGSSGSALAGRLAANNKIKILLIESGPKDYNPYIKMPIGYGKLFYDQRVNWKFSTEPEKNLNRKRMYWPRGKVLGGSSSINAMVFARGSKSDFDEWGENANGWHWQDVEPFFRKMESWKGASNQGRGYSGPVQVTDVSKQAHPLTNRYLEATEQIGITQNPDYNTGNIEGSFVYQTNTHKGLRSSASSAYLSQQKKRRNLVIITRAHVKKILFEGSKAVGVEYSHKGKINAANAAKEIILSAGALASPQLLQLSGIGPAKTIKDLNIKVISDLPDVGLHLKDHIGLDHTLLTNQPSLNQLLRPLSGKIKVAFQYLLTRSGPLSMSLNQGGGFVKSDRNLTVPDLQLYFSPLSYTTAPLGKRPLMAPDPYPAVRLGFSLCKPTSEGNLSVQSPDSSIPPKFFGNYLSTEYDQKTMISGMKLIRKLSKTDALREIILSEKIPGEDVKSDEDLLDFARANAETVFHQCGTCRMGNNPLNSVVDEKLKVRGVSGLRVADASIFPTIPSGNINAPSIMVGEKAAEMILDS